MKTIFEKFGDDYRCTVELDFLIRNRLDGSAHIEKKIQNVSAAVAALIELLVDKKALTEREVLNALGLGYDCVVEGEE